jgi:hypothetical protein
MTADERSFLRLLADAGDQLSRLMRSEIKVVRAEMAEKATAAATGLAAVIVAAILAVPALVLLLMALASWLVELGLRASLANLAAAGAGLVVCAVLLLIGKSRLSPDALKPQRIAREIERDADAARRAV